MASSGDIRKQIWIDLQSNSNGVAERAAEEIRRLKGEVASLTTEFAENGGEAEAFKAGIAGLTSELQFWTATQKAATAATIEADAENTRYQATLRAMASDVATAAANQDAWAASLKKGTQAVESHVAGLNAERDAERKFQAELEKTMVGLHKLEIDTIKMVAATSAAEDRRLEKVEANYNREQAARDKVNLSAANWILKQQTMQTSLAATEAEAARSGLDDAVAKRQMANAAAGAAKEQEHLNQVIRAGIGEMMVEQTAATGATASLSGMGRAAMTSDQRMKHFSFSILAAGYTFQDLTSAGTDWERGITATLNNVPQLVMGFSGAMGISYQSTMLAAGAATALAAGTMVVYQNWGFLKDKMGVGIPRPVLDSAAALSKELSEATSEFEKLGKTTRLSLVDLERYKALNQQILDIKKKQREEDEIATLKKIESEESGKTAAGVKKAIGESGGFDQMAGSLSAALQAEGDKLGSGITQAEALKQAETMIKNASDGDKGARDMIKRVIKEFSPQGGMHDIYANLTKFSPEYERLGDQEKEQADKAQKEAERKAKVEKDWDEGVRWQENHDAAEERRQEAEAAQEKNRAVQELMVGKAKPLGGEFEKKANDMAIAGKGREAIETALSEEMANRLAKQGADPGISKEAAKRLVASMVERAFGAIAAQGDVTAREGAMAIDAVKVQKEGETIGKGLRKNAREAKKVDERVERGRIKGAMMHDFGMNPQEAEYAAPRVQREMQRGVPGAVAGRSVAAEMQKFIQTNYMNMLQVQATQEQMAGMFGQASQQLQVFRQQQMQVRQNMRQGQQPSFLQPFR